MAMNLRDRRVYRADDKQDHGLLKDEERRKLLESHLPPPPSEQEKEKEAASTKAKAWEKKKQSRPKGRFGVRYFLKNQLYLLVFTILHSIFSLYIRIRQAWHTVSYRLSSILYYHHRTPELIEKDVKPLHKKPSHLSAILKMEAGSRATELQRLINEAADLAVWSACAGIPKLSIYEKTGILKKSLPQIHHTILQRFSSYYGQHHPGLSVTAPHTDALESPSTELSPGPEPKALEVRFLSHVDGRDSMVDLTKILADMSQNGNLGLSSIQTDIINRELCQGIVSEPDLLLCFGPYVELQGFPPWQIRLTEIFCLQDNRGVGYQVFIRGLRKYAAAQMRNGK